MKQTHLLTSSLAAFVIFTGQSVAEVVEPRGLNHPMRQTLRDMDQVRADAEAVHISSYYCLPPKQPQKQATLAALDALQGKLHALKGLITQYKATYDRAGQDEAGEALRGAYPPVDGTLPPAHDEQRESVYWSKANAQAVPAQDAINAKRAALRKAREIDCDEGAQTKTDIAVQPPLPPPPPPPPPEPPKERLWDPLAGLTKPTLTAADYPVAPQFFCSQAEKDAMLARINPAQAKLQSEADAYEAYAKAVEARKAQLTAEGLPDHWQKSLDYEAGQARQMRDDRLTTIRSLETVRKYIEGIPVVDCTVQPKDELKTGWDFKAGLEAGLGQVTLPDAGYLGVEDTISLQRIDGAIKAAAQDSNARQFRGGFELPLDWTPPNLFDSLGGRHLETRFFGTLETSSAKFRSSGDFDPSGDRLFVPGLSDNIADTFTLPPTFNATVRDNFVDRFFYSGAFDRSELAFGLREDFGFPGCDDFTLTKSFGLTHSWSDKRESFQADVLNYFPVASPGFDVRTSYASSVDSTTTALRLGFDGVYAPKSWNGFFLTAGLDGWVGLTDSDGWAYRRLDIDGGIGEQGARFSKSDTTSGFGLRGGIGFDFGGGKIELGAEYRQDGDTPVTHFGVGEAPTIRHDERDEFIGVLRTTFMF